MSVSSKAAKNTLRTKGFRFVGFILSSLIIDSYLRRPPPRPPPPPRDPILEAPRELLARALPPLIPPEPPPKAPPPLEEPSEPDETLRLPTRSPPPPPPRFAPRLLAPLESPRAVPPYLFAVALFE